MTVCKNPLLRTLLQRRSGGSFYTSEKIHPHPPLGTVRAKSAVGLLFEPMGMTPGAQGMNRAPPSPLKPH